MKKTLLLGAALIAALPAALQAQVNLKVDTAFTTGTSGGFNISNFFTGGTSAGSTVNKAGGFMLAEDFTVPAGESWTISDATVYAYQTQTTGPFNTTNTITTAYAMIFSGTLGTNAVLKYGDTATNRLTSSTFSNVQRQFSDTGLLGRARPVMAVKMTLPGTPALGPGTYWLAYGLKGNSALTGPFSPSKVTPAKANPGGNGMQLSGTTWSAALDGTAAIGFNMIIRGTKGAAGVDATSGANSISLSNSPNPVHGSTNISFHLPQATQVRLSLLDATGRIIRVIADDRMVGGDYLMPLNASELAAGMYYYQLQTGEQTLTRSMQVQ